jgi:hypothetical protein
VNTYTEFYCNGDSGYCRLDRYVVPWHPRDDHPFDVLFIEVTNREPAPRFTAYKCSGPLDSLDLFSVFSRVFMLKPVEWETLQGSLFGNAVRAFSKSPPGLLGAASTIIEDGSNGLMLTITGSFLDLSHGSSITLPTGDFRIQHAAVVFRRDEADETVVSDALLWLNAVPSEA